MPVSVCIIYTCTCVHLLSNTTPHCRWHTNGVHSASGLLVFMLLQTYSWNLGVGGGGREGEGEREREPFTDTSSKIGGMEVAVYLHAEALIS